MVLPPRSQLTGPDGLPPVYCQEVASNGPADMVVMDQFLRALLPKEHKAIVM